MRAPSGASLTKAIPHPDDLEHLESRLRDEFLGVIHAAGETAASRFEHFANQETHPAALTAAPGVGPSTAMVAVYPTDEQAAAMRQPNGEDSAILHVTLAFLGELEPDRAEMAAGVARKVASANQALSGSVGGVGAFGDNGAGHPSILMPDVVGLAELRHAVCTALCDAGIHFVGCQCSGLERDSTRTEHGWTPHMTLGYHDELTVPPKHLLGRPLDFGQLSFAQGDVRRDFDFAAEGDWVLPALGVTRGEIAHGIPTRDWMSGNQVLYFPSWAYEILKRRGALTAGAVVAESETGIEIGNVAKAHAEAAAPDYGDTYWNEAEGVVFWISADWTSIDEADAAIADFLAIEGVQSVEECAECGAPGPADEWEQVYSNRDQDPPKDETELTLAESEPDLYAGTSIGQRPASSLTAAGPPWTQPHPDELVDVDTLVSRFRGKADPVRRAAVEAAAAPALEKAGLSFDATNPFIDDVVGGIGQHVTFIADTTRLNVIRIVRRSYEDGLSIPDTAKAIREGMAAAAGSRATLIARTEMTSLVNGGGLAAMNVITDAGVGTYLKRWLTAPGASYPRHEDYEGLDGQTVALNGVFDVGGSSLAYPGDPDGPPEEVCNCRCVLVYIEGGAPSAGESTVEEPIANDVGAPADPGLLADTEISRLIKTPLLGRADGGPEARDALAAIDKVISVPMVDAEPVAIRANRDLPSNVHARTVSHAEGSLVVTDGIEINPNGIDIETYLTHEVAHVVDQNLLHGNYGDVISEIHKTDLWKQVEAYDGPAARADYYRRERELFARAFSQWIAERSGNPVMRRQIEQIAADAKSVGIVGGSGLQWESADFTRVGAALDRLFADRGLLREPPKVAPPDRFSAPTAPFLPPTAVEKIESLGLDTWPPQKGALAKKVFGNAADTVELYKRNGQWLPEREAQHENIISQHFAGKAPSDRRDAFFTSGGGASGKGSASFLVDGQEVGLEELGARPDVILVDPDRIKKMLPEYQELFAGHDPFAASGVHEESSQLAKDIVDEAIKRGYSVVLDTTGSSSGFIGKIDKFVKAGYKPQVTMFSIPTNEAIRRSIARAERVGGNSFGRYVSIFPLKDAHAGASRQLAKWSKEKSIDSWRVFDNSANPELVAQGGGGQIEILDPDKWAAILAKAKETEE